LAGLGASEIFMTNEANEPSEVFQTQRIRELIELMREFDLNEIDLKHSPRRIRLRRGTATVVNSLSAGAFLPASAPPTSAPASGTLASAPPAPAENLLIVRSPMVGTFYARPKPDKPPFVSVGDPVSPETVVCIVEAMKMFNEIPAGVSGKIVEICLKDGESVDVNKPLFKVAP
jgi:acetyl-CoA carboxylase biotin carboxyl carrier protein